MFATSFFLFHYIYKSKAVFREYISKDVIYKSIYIVRPPAACPPFGHKADLRGAVAVKVAQYLRLSPDATRYGYCRNLRVRKNNTAVATAFAVECFIVGFWCHKFAGLFLAVAVEIVWLALGETSQIGQHQTQQNKIIMHFHRIFYFQIQRIFGEKLLHI